LNHQTESAVRSGAIAVWVILAAGCGAVPEGEAARGGQPAAAASPAAAGSKGGSGGIVKIVKSDSEWRRELTPAQYHVLREKGTEFAFTGALLQEKRAGVFRCAACDLELFASGAKFESGTGWPSFYEPIAAPNVTEIADDSYGMRRIEVNCSRCGGHLGHVFDDGPRPTGLRYCINSVSLKFDPAKTAKTVAKTAEKAAVKADSTH